MFPQSITTYLEHPHPQIKENLIQILTKLDAQIDTESKFQSLNFACPINSKS